MFNAEERELLSSLKMTMLRFAEDEGDQAALDQICKWKCELECLIEASTVAEGQRMFVPALLYLEEVMDVVILNSPDPKICAYMASRDSTEEIADEAARLGCLHERNMVRLEKEMVARKERK